MIARYQQTSRPRLLKSPPGFSLVELLIVIAVIGLLAVLAQPAFQYIARSSNLTSAGDFLRDGLEMARQTAVTRNSTVEVRVYQLPTAPGGSPTDYRAFQVFLRGTGTPPAYTAVTPVTYFPQQIVLSTDPAKTSFLNYLTVQPGTAGGSLSPWGTGYNYIYFWYTPSEGTNLNPADTWFATLIPKTAPASNGGLPADFITLRVDPVIGNVAIFHP